jgi:hypothetical protein
MQSAGTENRPFPMENVAIFLATNQHYDKSAALCAGIHSNVSKNTG